MCDKVSAAMLVSSHLSPCLILITTGWGNIIILYTQAESVLLEFKATDPLFALLSLPVYRGPERASLPFSQPHTHTFWVKMRSIHWLLWHFQRPWHIGSVAFCLVCVKQSSLQVPHPSFILGLLVTGLPGGQHHLGLLGSLLAAQEKVVSLGPHIKSSKMRANHPLWLILLKEYHSSGLRRETIKIFFGGWGKSQRFCKVYKAYICSPHSALQR